MSSMTSIAGQADEFKSNLASQAPAEIIDVFDAEQVFLAESTDTSRFVKVGERLGEFELPSATGDTVSLARLVADGPAVIVFYRGEWCPYCNITLATYGRELAPELERRGVSLAAVSPQVPDGSLTMKERHDLAFHVLSDPNNDVASRLGIVFSPADDVLEAGLKFGNDLAAANGQDAVTLPMPTVLVVDTDRTIRFVDVHPDYTERTEVGEILAAVDEVRSKA